MKEDSSSVLSNVETDLTFALIINDKELLGEVIKQNRALKVAQAVKDKYPDNFNNINSRQVDWVQLRRLFARARRLGRAFPFLKE